MPTYTLIIRDNKYCQFITDDQQTFNSLRACLSYRMVGVEYTAAYQNGWSGTTYLMDKKGVFPSGLRHKVKQHLQEQQITVVEEDRRIVPATTAPLNIDERLQQLKLIPRDYQQRIVDTALANDKGIVRACTGSGKTLCTAIITAKLNQPTIIYVIGLDLLQQFHNLFSSIFDEPIGFIGNGVCDIQRINIASIWTIGRALKLKPKNILREADDDLDEKELDENANLRILKMLGNTKTHIFDESHVVATDTIKQIYKAIDPERIYGFSGTPFRDDNTDLLVNGILGEQIIDVSASELITKGVLAQPIIKFVPVPSARFPDLTYPSVYKEYVVENNVRNQLILDNVQMLLEKKYTPLVLFKQIKHGKTLLKLFQEANIECEMLYGDDTLARREEVKQMLLDGEIRVILASTIFDLGVDIPMLNALVLCGSGKSTIRSLQRIGRVIRGYPGKKVAAVIDFFDRAKFLQKQSSARYQTYTSEPGFKVFKCQGMK